jgi:mannose-6-phosphate isomerase
MFTLYPMKFAPVFKEKIWGGERLKQRFGLSAQCKEKIGEAWLLSSLPDNESILINGHFHGNTLIELCDIFMDDLLGEKHFEKFKTDFPLLLKFIDTNDFLSVQVHPNDLIAQKKHNTQFGKSEMWYVIEAEQSAMLYAGFSQEMNKELLMRHIQNNTVQEVLKPHSVKAGDVLYIPAGLVHAIGPGILLAEIQQSSDITYRLYDWNRREDQGVKRELHIEDAIDAIDFSINAQIIRDFDTEENRIIPIIETSYFNVSYIDLQGVVEKNLVNLDAFIIYVCLSGQCSFLSEGKNTQLFAGECILIPAIAEHIQITNEPQALLLEIHIP